MGDLLIHKGRRMTESETRMAVNWGIEHGYKYGSELPDTTIDEICDPHNHDYDQYDDTPQFFTLASLREILGGIASCGYLDE